jgi:hypothetical protein
MSAFGLANWQRQRAALWTQVAMRRCIELVGTKPAWAH